MRFYNATLEKVKKQFDSRVFVFNAHGFTEIPEYLIPFVVEALKDKGIFKAPEEMSEAEFDEAERQALIAYKGITLRERNVNYLAYQDDMRKKGATLLPDPRHERCIRWDKELGEILSQKAPIEEELSFLEARRLKNTVLEEAQEVETSFAPKKRGRPAKVEATV